MLGPIKHHLPKILPVGWHRITCPIPYNVAYVNEGKGLKVMMGILPLDGCDWVHFSVSGMTLTDMPYPRLPTYDELVETKEIFLGTDTKAVMVFPPRKEWVNINPHVLHLFRNIDKDPLPDFTMGTGSL